VVDEAGPEQAGPEQAGPEQGPEQAGPEQGPEQDGPEQAGSEKPWECNIVHVAVGAAGGVAFGTLVTLLATVIFFKVRQARIGATFYKCCLP